MNEAVGVSKWWNVVDVVHCIEEETLYYLFTYYNIDLQFVIFSFPISGHSSETIFTQNIHLMS